MLTPSDHHLITLAATLAFVSVANCEAYLIAQLRCVHHATCYKVVGFKY